MSQESRLNIIKKYNLSKRILLNSKNTGLGLDKDPTVWLDRARPT